jgi:xanthine dehydrogenase accessory factor
MAEADHLWSEAVRVLEASRPFALATVINVRGSTPREVGAKMLVHETGQTGTIGGGCGEAEVFRKARILLTEGERSRLAEVDLTGDLEQTAALLTVIEGGAAPLVGGTKTLINPARECGDREGLFLNEAALAQLRQLAQVGSPALLELDTTGGVHPVVRLDPSTATRVFLDPVGATQHLIIAGAGHIAQPLASLGSMLGFRVTIIDDRASFANRERFPTADQIIVKPFAAAVDSLKLDRHCYLVSVTRGHAFDDETIRAALRQPAGFIGMIGSRRRVRATLARLEEEGYDPARLDEIHAPLGLDIGAETPEEIALSIMAEIIRERRTGKRDDFTLGVRSGRLRARG